MTRRASILFIITKNYHKKKKKNAYSYIRFYKKKKKNSLWLAYYLNEKSLFQKNT